MPVDAQTIIALLAATGGGAIAKTLVDYALSRGDRRQERLDALNKAKLDEAYKLRDQQRADQVREDAIATANDKLAGELREEQRRDNEALRKRAREMEERIVFVVGKMDSLAADNVTLRSENMKLQRQSGAESERLSAQANTIADQALKLSAMENALASAQKRIGVLESALVAARITVPPGTGPLGKG